MDDQIDLEQAYGDTLSFISELRERINSKEKGYRKYLKQTVTALVAATEAAGSNFSKFEKILADPVFRDDKKLTQLTKMNYQQHVARCVVKLGFKGTCAGKSTKSKILTVVKFLNKEGIKPGKCATKIDEYGGLEKLYEHAKDVQVRNSSKKSAKKTGSGHKSSKAAKKLVAAGHAMKISADRHGKGIISKPEVGDLHSNRLWIDLTEAELADFIKDPDYLEERTIRVQNVGRDEKIGFVIWELLDFEVEEQD